MKKNGFGSSNYIYQLSKMIRMCVAHNETDLITRSY